MAHNCTTIATIFLKASCLTHTMCQKRAVLCLYHATIAIDGDDDIDDETTPQHQCRKETDCTETNTQSVLQYIAIINNYT